MPSYRNLYNTRETPQSEPVPGKDMVANNAGGYNFKVDDWARLDRFLILGSDGGTYYTDARKLTWENAEVVRRCLEADGIRTVTRIREISQAGRAPKNDPALFALAMAVSFGDEPTRRAGFSVLSDVARIGTHIFQFAEYVEGFRGWGSGLRRAVSNWYLDQDEDRLAYQLIKYRQRNGWSHRDLLRLAHPKPYSEVQNALFRYATQGYCDFSAGENGSGGLSQVRAYDALTNKTPVADVVKAITTHRLPWEAVPTDHLRSPQVWEALMENMPLGAMVRNLGRLSNIGLLTPMSDCAKQVGGQLGDIEILRASRIHPINLLVALRTYQSGGGFRGAMTWTPVPSVVDELDGAFYNAFANVEPTGKRFLLGVDVSGSMSQPVMGASILSCAEAAVAMSLVTAKTEAEYYIHGFSGDFVDLGFTAKTRLDNALKCTRRMNFGDTDCALPMQHALKHNIPVDVFIVYTDNETWYGNVHPHQALVEYRQKTGIPAKLIVSAFTSTYHSIADPDDAGSLDVVGFDTTTPAVIADFARN